MVLPLRYSVRSVWVRKSASAMAVGGIALVVLVLVFLQAMAEGLRRAVATSGDPGTLIVLRKGSEAELGSQILREDAQVVATLPWIAHNARGEALCVSESALIVGRTRRDGGQSNLTIRGTTPLSAQVHHGVRLVSGRWLRPGTSEAVVGVALARRLDGLSLGQRLEAGGQRWPIVGVFAADGSALESEVWVDIAAYQPAFRRQRAFTSVLFRAAGDPALALRQVARVLEEDPRLQTLEAMAEDTYYAKQSKLMHDVIMVLTAILTTVMSLGAIVGAMNTMYAAVSYRQREIGCLLALGFTPAAVWLAFIAEAVALSLVGALIGCALSLPFNGRASGTTNWATFAETGFRFEITPAILGTAVLAAVAMGFLGGFLPAFRAARMRVVEALRRG
jgi:putative ABC transport system permease protein